MQELGNIQQQPLVENRPLEDYIKRRTVKPLEQRSNSPEDEETNSFRDDSSPFKGNTGKFVYPMESKPFQNNFMLNNLTSIEENSPKKSLTPNKPFLNSKYSYSWQKFIKTNQ